MTDSRGIRTLPDPQAKRLTWLYVTALSFVALLTIAGQVATQRSIARQLDDSRIVNLAGRQRMLSQRLTQLALRLERASPERRIALRKEYAEAFDSWTAAHEGLRYGSESLDMPGNDSDVVETMYTKLDRFYLPMREAGTTVLASSSKPFDAERLAEATEDWLNQESSFLEAMDAIVFQYDAEARSRVDRLRLIETALLIATLSTLAAEAIFVFRPAVGSIVRHVERLRNLNEELVRAERRASDADAAKTQFLAGMSHELRTPMSAILGAAELSLERSEDPSAKRLLDALHQSAKSLSGMLDELLDLASFDAGAGPAIANASFELRGAIERTAELFRPNAERKGLRFSIEFESNVPASAIGDEKRLSQILSNLLSNAIKFTDEGAVELRAGAELETVDVVGLVFEVIDTGPGVRPEHSASIFERFSRIDPSLRRKAGGAGLGLSISSELVKAMGGTLELDPDRDIGSRFILRLPLGQDVSSTESNGRAVTDPPKARSVRPASSRELPRTARRALLADDSDSSRLLLAERLRDLGFAVTEVANGRQALETARLDGFDAILLDLEMPGLDGFEAAISIKQERTKNDAAAPRLIAVTAHPPDAVRTRCLEAGFDAFLSKPVSATALLNELGPDLRPGSLASENLLAEPHPVNSIIDLIRTRFLKREPLLLRLIELFLDESAGLNAQLRSAAEERNRQGLVAALHRWKGMCANFGVGEVDGRFIELEDRLSAEGEISPAALAPLLRSIAELEAALRRIQSDSARQSARAAESD